MISEPLLAYILLGHYLHAARRHEARRGHRRELLGADKVQYVYRSTAGGGAEADALDDELPADVARTTTLLRRSA